MGRGKRTRALLALAGLAGIVPFSPHPAERAAAVAGATLWERSYDGPSGAGDAARDSVASSDGSRIFVSGSVASENFGDIATVAYNARTGAPLWTRQFNAIRRGSDDVSDLTVSPDGTTVILTGTSEFLTSGLDYVTIAYDAASGATKWFRRYHAGRDQASAIAMSPDGTRVFVTGISQLGTAGWGDYATIAYDVVTGRTIWIRRYNSFADDQDSATDIAAGPDGTLVVVTGISRSLTGGHDFATIAYRSESGGPVWLRRYDGPTHGTDFATSTMFTPDGSTVLVAGSSERTGSGRDFAVATYRAATGATVWIRRLNGVASRDDTVTSAVISPDGSLAFVAGNTTNATGLTDFTVIAYRMDNGASAWSRTSAAPPSRNGIVASAVASPDGTTVFIGGYSPAADPSNEVLTTIAYDASTGQNKWLSTRSGARGFSLVANPVDRIVYSSGQDQTTSDFLTIAYSTA